MKKTIITGVLILIALSMTTMAANEHNQQAPENNGGGSCPEQPTIEPKNTDEIPTYTKATRTGSKVKYKWKPTKCENNKQYNVYIRYTTNPYTEKIYWNLKKVTEC